MEKNAELERFAQCRIPEELFGELTGDAPARLAELNNRYRGLALRCHPDLFQGEPAAEAAFKVLTEMHRQAEERIRQGVYGTPRRGASADAISILKTRRREYRVRAALAEGTVADVYLGEFDGPDGAVQRAAIKIARDPKDNALLINEQKLLGKLRHVSLPELLDVFETKAGQLASVLSYIDGLDGYALRKLKPHRRGLQPRLHIGWILERQLALLGYLHSQMVVHGNIEPGHLLVVPQNHNVALLDYCFALANPGKEHIRILNDDYSAPETARRGAALPAADIYALGKCAVYLLGGDPAAGALPSDLDERYARLIESMIEPDPARRANDAWQLAHELVSVREEVDGRRRFVPLDV